MTTLIIADRDGTLIEDKHYLSSPDMVSVIPGVISAVKLLEESKIDLIVATNQSGVGRGYFDEKSVIEVNNRCQSLIDPHRKVLKHFFYCIHSPIDHCDCRKPLTGMVDQFLISNALNYDSIYVVGDRMSDIELGANLKALPILVLTGKGRQTHSSLVRPNLKSNYLVAETFRKAVELILEIETYRSNLP